MFRRRMPPELARRSRSRNRADFSADSGIAGNSVAQPKHSSSPEVEQRINLGAAAAGWVLPGLGQIVLGERRRGVLAMVGVLLLVVSGVFVGGLDAVDRDEDRLWFIGQAVAGPIVIGLSYANDALIKSGRFGSLLDAPSRPTQGNSSDASPPKVSTLKGIAHPNEFGALLIFLGGLMNLIVLLDALVRVPEEPTFGRRTDDAPATRGTT